MTAVSRRVRLATWPTPLEPAPRLSRALGLAEDDLWLKRDDLVGLGGGGNKVRKLEWIIGAALEDGADVLVTTGAAQSNHARLTAAAGARLGLEVVLVLTGGAGAASSGNLALDGLLGVRVVWAGDVDAAGRSAVAEEVAAELVRAGRRPAVIPFGGSSPLGARGYRECAAELLEQAPDLRTVVTALGSGGTMAGLVAGLGADRVLGVHVGAVTDPARTVASLVAELTGAGCDPGGLRLRADQVGEGYATMPEPVVDALVVAARSEGVVLDPVYTGRAMAGLRAAVAAGDVRRGERTVFLHSGGLPGLFGSAAAIRRAQAMLG